MHTHTHTHKVTDATDYPIHASATAGVGVIVSLILTSVCHVLVLNPDIQTDSLTQRPAYVSELLSEDYGAVQTGSAELSKDRQIGIHDLSAEFAVDSY